MKPLAASRLLLLLLLCIGTNVHATTYYWVKNTAASWNTSSSWSLTSGGPPLVATYPSAAADVAIFNGGGIGNCTVNVNLGISSIQLNAGYTGTVANNGLVTTAVSTSFIIASGTWTSNGGLINITGTYSQTGGTFNGSSAAVTVWGTFTKTGGTLNGSSLYIDFRNNVTISSTGAFNHNSGTVIFSGLTPIINCAVTFAHVTFQPSSASTTATITGTITALGILRIAGTGPVILNGGIVDVYSGVICSNTSTGGGGTAVVKVSGSGTSTVQGTVPLGQSRLPNLTIAVLGGSFGFSGSVTVAGNLLYDPPGTVGINSINHAVGSVVGMTGTNVTLTCSDAAIVSGTSLCWLCDLTLMTGASVQLGSYCDVANLTLQSGTVLDVTAANHGLFVSGNWVNQNTTAGSFNERTGWVFMVGGSITSSVTGGETFYGLELTNSACCVTLVLNSRVNIAFCLKDNFTFNVNLISSPTNAPLVFLDNATMFYSNSTWMTLVVTTTVIKIGNEAFSFPVGYVALSGQRYSRPVSISAPAVATDEFSVQYTNANSNALYPHALRDPSILTLSQCEYWTINRTGVSSVYVTPSFWSTATPACTVVAPNDLVVCRWTGATWFNHGQSSNTFTSGNGTVTSSSAVSAFGVFTIGSSSIANPLPIELISFNAATDEHEVFLNWQTASETNNDYFTIERSQDGATIESIDTVDGAGNSTTVKDYHTTDPAPYAGFSYYRLKQVDFDGHSSYSEWKMVYVESAVAINVYPNPSDGNISINLTGESDALWTLTILDLSGKTVLEQTGPKTAFQSVYVDISQGSYILRLESSTGTYSQFMTITD